MCCIPRANAHASNACGGGAVELLVRGPAGIKPEYYEQGQTANRTSMNKYLLRLWPWLAAIITGLLAAGSLPPFNQTWLCWFALVPLTFAIWFSENSRRRWLRDFALGYVAGLVFFWTSFYWLTSVTALGWFVLQFYMALYFAAWGWCCGMMRPREDSHSFATDKWSEMLARAKSAPPPSSSPWLKSGHNMFLALSLAAAWVALEWIRGWLFSGFGWNGLGIALHNNWPLIQIAEFTGVAGVSFLVAFSNVILATTARRLWQESRTRAMRPHYDLTLTMVVLVGVFATGLNAVQSRGPTRPLKVAMVQSAVPQEDKFDLRNKQKIFEKFAHLSEIALSSSEQRDLLIWPESAMPAPVLVDQETFDFVDQLAAAKNVSVLLGAIDEDQTGVYNSALLFSPTQPVQSYRKVHLVPFGEYVPFRHSFPFFAYVVGDQVPADFDAGREYTVFNLPGNHAHIAPLICFEDTIGELSRRFVLRGADVLANVTNDGWFLRSAGSRQHLANAVFRCVETRRPMMRAANTGVTCLVNEFGRVTQMLRDDHGSIFEEGTLIGIIDVPTDSRLTFYTRHGELFAKLCVLFASLILLVKLVSRVTARRNHAL
jgi:apolipoprotein N-acyltransferase